VADTHGRDSASLCDERDAIHARDARGSRVSRGARLIELDPRPLRIAGAAMLGVAAVLPLLGHGAGVPCPLRTMTGVPCPLCGMTRGVTATVHGDVARAAFLNPASVLLVALVVALLLGWRRRSPLRFPRWLPFALVTAMWAWQLFKYATGRPL
jgi:hypothetical protein